MLLSFYTLCCIYIYICSIEEKGGQQPWQLSSRTLPLLEWYSSLPRACRHGFTVEGRQSKREIVGGKTVVAEREGGGKWESERSTGKGDDQEKEKYGKGGGRKRRRGDRAAADVTAILDTLSLQERRTSERHLSSRFSDCYPSSATP